MRVANTYHVGVPDLDRLGASYLVVCVQSAPNLYACYAGLVQLPSIKRPRQYEATREKKAEKVAAGGLKLTYKQALAYFPALKESQYAH